MRVSLTILLVSSSSTRKLLSDCVILLHVTRLHPKTKHRQLLLLLLPLLFPAKFDSSILQVHWLEECKLTTSWVLFQSCWNPSSILKIQARYPNEIFELSIKFVFQSMQWSGDTFLWLYFVLSIDAHVCSAAVPKWVLWNIYYLQMSSSVLVHKYLHES